MSIDFEIVEDGIARITLNRPERHNAFDEEHYRDLSLAWARVRDDQAIRVAIITGAGEKSFSSGADLKSFFGKRTATEMWLTVDQHLKTVSELRGLVHVRHGREAPTRGF